MPTTFLSLYESPISFGLCKWHFRYRLIFHCLCWLLGRPISRNLKCSELSLTNLFKIYRAGLSSIYTGSKAKIPTSAYSLSMTLAANVGFHDAGPQAIGEDMHMFIKCLFSTGGNLISETIYSPASQLDVVAGVRGGLMGFWNDHVARYKQAIRHMWGSRKLSHFNSNDK